MVMRRSLVMWLRMIIAQSIGRQFINIKMKRSDNVRTLATITSTVKIKDKVVVIEPMVLYQRMLLVKKDSNDLAGYFKYGLALILCTFLLIQG